MAAITMNNRRNKIKSAILNSVAASAISDSATGGVVPLPKNLNATRPGLMMHCLFISSWIQTQAEAREIASRVALIADRENAFNAFHALGITISNQTQHGNDKIYHCTIWSSEPYGISDEVFRPSL